MTKLETMKDELEEIKDEISGLNEEIDRCENERDLLEEKIERYREAEKLESVVIAALNKNYNRWCSRSYLEKNIRWDETDFEDEDEEERMQLAVAACELLVEKGIVQQKETGSYDDNLDPICEYRITDTETIDMFEEGGK